MSVLLAALICSLLANIVLAFVVTYLDNQAERALKLAEDALDGWERAERQWESEGEGWKK